MNFNDYIKQLRNEKGVTQQEISTFLEIDQSTYAHYESGRRTPDLEKLRRIATYYGLIDELLGVNPIDSVINGLPLYGKFYRFPRLMESPIELERIYPTKQKIAVELYKVLNPDKRVISAMLFGSSITMKCTKESDTDIAVRLDTGFIDRDTKNEISERILELCDWKADILWFDTLDHNEKIYKDICMGVQIA